MAWKADGWMRWVLMAALAAGCGVTAVRAQDGAPSSVARLEAFGALDSPQAIREAYAKAIEALSRTGGLLVVPAEAAAHVTVENTSQISPRTPAPPAETKSWRKAGPGVTVVEVGETATTLRVPSVQGLFLDRTLRMDREESLPHWSTDFALNIRNNLIHGSNSYLDWIMEPVSAGANARFYVRSNRGIRPGMFLNLHGGPGYGGGVTRGAVREIGYDPEKRLDYFTADTGIDHVKGAIVHNKNNVGIMHLSQNAHADEQTYDIMLRRRQLAGGDTYMFFAWYEYMSNIHSAAGDENGNLFAGYSKSIDTAFAGTVASVNWDARDLVFAPGAQNIEMLGQSRPLINMNPTKWITAGSVMVVPAESYWDTTDTGKFPFEGQTYPTTLQPGPQGNPELRMGGLIRGDAETPWDAGIIGRWFGITDPTERTPKERKIRWYRIVDLTVNPDGTKDLTIQRYWWGAKPAGSPTLYRLENNTWDGHVRPLEYAIAPGSYVTDVSRAVPGNGYPGERTLGLTPFVDQGSAFDFETGDAIEQAIGPDPFKPIPFRMWTWDNVPGVFPSPVLDLANWGADPRYAAMAVRGSQRSLDQLPGTARQLPPWDNAIIVEAAAGVGLNLSADFTDAAILFQQNYNEQPIKWHYGAREAGQPVAEAVLTVSRETGALNFTGDAAFGGSIHANGLSADKEVPARNLRGKLVPVPAGATSIDITLPVAEADGEYALFIEQTWLSNRAVTRRSADGFSVEFDRPAPLGATLDWMLVR